MKVKNVLLQVEFALGSDPGAFYGTTNPRLKLPIFEKLIVKSRDFPVVIYDKLVLDESEQVELSRKVADTSAWIRVSGEVEALWPVGGNEISAHEVESGPADMEWMFILHADSLEFISSLDLRDTTER